MANADRYAIGGDWTALRCSSPKMKRECVRCVRHLIEEHGYKRIAFIRGIRDRSTPNNVIRHIRMNSRRMIYVLMKTWWWKGITHTRAGAQRSASCWTSASFVFRLSSRQMTAWHSAPWRRFNNAAFVSQKMWLLPGFDDLREAQATGVPLTTVRQSFYTAGKHALEALLKRIDGDTVPRNNHTHPVTHPLVMRMYAGECPSGGGCAARRCQDWQVGKQTRSRITRPAEFGRHH